MPIVPRRQPESVVPAKPTMSYLRGLPGGTPLILSGPLPRLRDASEDVQRAWAQAAARGIDAMHNIGWIAGLVDQMASLMIGDMLRPNLKPDMSMFGWDEKQTDAWAALAEKRFMAWASNPYECDAGGRYSLGQQQAAMVRQWAGTGEALVEYPTIARPGGTWATKMRLLPSHWLSRKTEPANRLKHGVYLDGHGAPAGYLFEVGDRHGLSQEIRKAARDAFGRPIVVHAFDGNAAQVRGITIFAPVLRVLRDYDELMRAGLTQHMLQTIFAGTIESDYPTTDVMAGLQDIEEQQESASPYEAYLTQKVGALGSVNIDLGRHGRLAHLPDGSKLKFHTPERTADNMEQIAALLLRETAKAAGVATEDVTGDLRGVSYTGVRMGIAKHWPLLLYRRRVIPTPPSQAALEAVIEEDVDSGALPLPGGIDAFVANKAAICRADWRGPAKPVADEIKAAKAHEMYRNMGVMSDEMICGDLGVDRDDVYRTRAFERRTREDFGIHGGVTNGGTDVDSLIDNEEAEAAAAARNAGNGQ